MSSEYYDAAAIERARQNRLMEELDREISKLETAYLQEYASIQNAIAADYAVEHLAEQHEYKENSVSGANELYMTDADKFSGGNILEAFDFSSILDDKGEHKFEEQFSNIISRISERKIRNAKDVTDRRRLVAVINEYLRDDDYDVEQKMLAISDRVELYLSMGISDDNHGIATNERYKALCNWLEIPEQNISEDVMQVEINKLQNMALKKKEREYIQDNIEAIMDELGLSYENSSILDGIEGDLYENEEGACNIFVSVDGQGIMLETVAKSGYTRSAVERDIKKTCGLQAQIVEKARDRGIILKKLQQSMPLYEEVVKEEELFRTEKKKEKARRRTAEKVQYMRE